MKFRLPLAVGVAALSFALPAGAQAASATPADVREHVRVADRALDQVKSFVRSNNDAAASKFLVRYRREMRAATKDAGRAHGSDAVAEVKRALGYRWDRCAVVLSRLVEQAGCPAQLDIAQAIRDCVGSREEAVADLTALLEVVPQPAKAALARAIAVLSQSGEQIVDQITGALGGGLIPPQVGDVLKQALEQAVAAVDMAIDRLKSITGLVPEVARPYVEMALGVVQQQLHMVTQLVTDLLGNLLGTAPGTPGGGNGSGLPFKLPINLPFTIPGFGFATR